MSLRLLVVFDRQWSNVGTQSKLPGSPQVLRAIICHPDSSDLLLYASMVAEFGLSPELVDPANVDNVLARIGLPALVVSGFSPADSRSVQLFESLRRFGGANEIPTLVTRADQVVVDAWRRARTVGALVVLGRSPSVQEIRDAIAQLTGRDRRARSASEVHAWPTLSGSAARAELHDERHAPAPSTGADLSWKSALKFVIDELNVPVCVLSLREGTHRRIIGAADFEMETGEDGLLESFVRLVEDANEPLVVPDAASHPLFERHPFIRAGLVRGYAGLPMRSSGEHKGAVCVFDSKPLQFGAPALERAARRVVQLGDIEGTRAAAPDDDPDAVLLAQTLKSAVVAPGFPLTLALVRSDSNNGQVQGHIRPVRDLAGDLRDLVRENDIVVPGRHGAVLLLLSVREAAANVALARLTRLLEQSGIPVRVATTEVTAGEPMSEAVARARRSLRPQP